MQGAPDEQLQRLLRLCCTRHTADACLLAGGIAVLLQDLVGKNLTYISQLDGLSFDLYSSSVLPRILEQVGAAADAALHVGVQWWRWLTSQQGDVPLAT